MERLQQLEKTLTPLVGKKNVTKAKGRVTQAVKKAGFTPMATGSGGGVDISKQINELIKKKKIMTGV